ncbi:ribosome-recycling factor [Clostridium sp. CAG:914]|jgi:ribosome recycling factor|nr:ribosome-recycling factor [Clostridium sp. CAG:914]
MLKYTQMLSLLKERGKMENIINNTEEKMMNAITTLENRFTNVRAGRANPNMLDGIMVEYYGVPTPLKQLANITIPEARQLSIKPFDKSALNGIEKAIFEANLGITPNNNGESIFLVVPALTEDRRKELVKQVHQMAEEGKIALRNIRQDANNAIKNLKLPEDEEKRGNERVQNLINEYNKIIEEKLKEKEKELMTI